MKFQQCGMVCSNTKSKCYGYSNILLLPINSMVICMLLICMSPCDDVNIYTMNSVSLEKYYIH